MSPWQRGLGAGTAEAAVLAQAPRTVGTAAPFSQHRLGLLWPPERIGLSKAGRAQDSPAPGLQPSQLGQHCLPLFGKEAPWEKSAMFSHLQLPLGHVWKRVTLCGGNSVFIPFSFICARFLNHRRLCDR